MRRHTTALAFVLFGVMATLGVVSAERVGRQMRVAKTCTAAIEGRFEDALAASEGLAASDTDGRFAAECRCRALGALGREGECIALLDGLLDEAPDWVPPPDLAAAVVRARQASGENARAVALARRASAAHPRDAALTQLEIAVRSPLEGETAVVEDVTRRLAAHPDALGPRLALGVVHSRRQDAARAAEALGETPPPASDPYLTFWFQARAWALANLGDLEGVRATYAAWLERGGDARAIQADYALQLSVAQLRDPDRTWIELIEGALEHEESYADPKVPAALYARWIGHLMVEDRHEEALALYDRAAARHELVGLTREQILQERVVASLVERPAAETKGTLVFSLPEGLAAATLWLSADPEVAPDAVFERHVLVAGEPLHLDRTVSVTPQRWVLTDEAGVRASGSAWPGLGIETPVAMAPRAPAALAPAFEPAQAPADGRRRVFVLIPDCGDWRLIQYLRARGELPVHDAMLQRGLRAVLESNPPVTAAAMEKLVWPERGRNKSVLGEWNRLGLEIGGLASVGRNPLGFLAAVLPESRSVFEVIGGGPHVAANLLFSHGGIDAGHHARRVGPHGGNRQEVPLPSARELRPEERALFRSPLSERGEIHARNLAAEMDVAVEIARAGEIDFVMLRLEPLDLLTHELFGELVGNQQDDGRSALLDAYRYLDARFAALWNALDEDDVLIVLSDHGARTAMEHSLDAFFVAVGGGVEPGRIPGMPEIGGVPRALAALFGHAEDWPETGVAASLVGETATQERRLSRSAP